MSVSGAQNVHHSSGASKTNSVYGHAEERKDAQIKLKEELHKGSAFDFAAKHPNIQTGGASIW